MENTTKKILFISKLIDDTKIKKLDWVLDDSMYKCAISESSFVELGPDSLTVSFEEYRLYSITQGMSGHISRLYQEVNNTVNSGIDTIMDNYLKG